MLSRDRKQQEYLDELRELVERLISNMNGQLFISGDQLIHIYTCINTVLGLISPSNLNDLNLLITSHIRQNKDACCIPEMYDVLQNLCLVLAPNFLLPDVAGVHSLQQVSKLMGTNLPNHLLLRQLIWSENEKNESQRRKILNELEWVSIQPLLNEKHNNIYYKCLNCVLMILELNSGMHYLFIGEVIDFLLSHSGSINSIKLIQYVEKCTGMFLTSLRKDECTAQNQLAKKKCIEKLKLDLQAIIKHLGSDSGIYKSDILELNKNIQLFFKQVGLIMMKNVSITGRLWGLSILGTEMADEKGYLQWILANNVLDMVLKESQKQKFIKNSGFLFELVLRHLGSYPELLQKIMNFLNTAQPPIRRYIFHYMEQCSIPDTFHEKILRSILSDSSCLTDQVFDIIIKYSPKLTSRYSEELLETLVSLYINKGDRLMPKCETAIIEIVVKVCEKRELEVEKIEILKKIYEKLLTGYFSQKKVEIFLKITDMILALYDLKEENKRKLVEILCNQVNVIHVSLQWISLVKSSKSVDKIEKMVAQIVERLTSASQESIGNNKTILMLSVRNVSIFKKLISFNNNIKVLENIFSLLLVNYDLDIPKQNIIGCLRHCLLAINSKKMLQNDGFIEVRCIASEIWGLDILAAYLMKSSSCVSRDHIAELISDIYVNYNFSVKPQADDKLVNLFFELMQSIQKYLYWDGKDNSDILGTLALPQNYIC